MPENDTLNLRISGALIPEKDKHTSGYLREREDFLEKQVRPALESMGEFTPEQINDRIALARETMNKQVLANATAGAQEKGNPKTYSAQTKQEETANKVSKGFFDSALGYLGGLFGGIGSFIMEVLIKPVFGDRISNWLSDTFSGKPPEQREKEQTAAGVADGARTEITIENQKFSLSQDAARGLYTKMLEEPKQTAEAPATAANQTSRPPVDPSIVPSDLKKPNATPDQAFNKENEGRMTPTGGSFTPTGGATAAPVTAANNAPGLP